MGILDGTQEIPDCEEYTKLINEIEKVMAVDDEKDDEKEEKSYKDQITEWVVKIQKDFNDSTTMESEIKRALATNTKLSNSKIAPSLLKNAKGFAFMMEIKA